MTTRQIENLTGNHSFAARAYFKGELTLYGYAVEALRIMGGGRIHHCGFHGATLIMPARGGNSEFFELLGPTVHGWRECNVARLEALKAEFASRAAGK